MSEEGGYEWLPCEKVWRYNRHVVKPRGDPVSYDFNGILQLALAALDKLREHIQESYEFI